MKDYGLLQVYTGSGKGKTTAALGGLCVLLAGEPKRSCCHFSKMILIMVKLWQHNTFHIFTEAGWTRCFRKFS